MVPRDHERAPGRPRGRVVARVGTEAGVRAPGVRDLAAASLPADARVRGVGLSLRPGGEFLVTKISMTTWQ